MSKLFPLLLVTAACAATRAPPAAAESVFADAQRLRTWCLGQGTVRAACVGYLTGVTDALRDPAAGAALCLPPKLAGEQIRLMFLNHVHDDPAAVARPAAGEVRAVLSRAFACAGPPRRDEKPRSGERISALSGAPS